ncbi:MAG: hypothetical protein AB9903_32315 [Vulcanimicrobiota bacterium]
MIRLKRQIYCSAAAALALILVFAAAGCGRKEVTVSFPLEKESCWIYSGEYTSQVASAKIRLPVSNHTIDVEGVENIGGATYMNTAVSIEGSIFSRFLLRKAGGKILCRDGESEAVLFPETLKLGEKWDVNLLGRTLSLQAKKVEEVKVPAGTYQALLISFKEKDRLEGNLWLADKVGIVALEFKETETKPARTVRLELKETGKSKGSKVSVRESRQPAHRFSSLRQRNSRSCKGHIQPV